MVFCSKCWSDPKRHDSLAERSKAVAQGAIPKGRGFKPHSCQLIPLAPLHWLQLLKHCKHAQTLWPSGEGVGLLSRWGPLRVGSSPTRVAAG